MAAAAIAVTEGREKVMDFSVPFMYYVFPTEETHIPSDMCSSTRETHIPSDMCSLPRKHISLVMCSPTWETEEDAINCAMNFSEATLFSFQNSFLNHVVIKSIVED